jgi:ABC-type transport system involved in cytochrome bd biosynthesis fused ATPase/permease subunit
MGTLRVAFLSALVLELCAMIGTALVAATIGVQLVGGELTLQAGLTVLLLAPELYGPLREVGQQFHASADGVAASERIFAAIEQSRTITRTGHPQELPDPSVEPLALDGVCFEYPGRSGLALTAVDLELRAGEITALVGESGSGKSTIAMLLLRFADPTRGRVRCGDVDLRELDVEQWRSQVAWVPQRPTLFTGSVAENVRLGMTHATDEQVHAAVLAAGAQQLITGLPQGLGTVIGDGGRRLSAGQGQRIALARAFLRNAPILILDEPTSHLDPETATTIADATQQLASGRTTLMIVHHDALAQRADRIVRIHSGRILATPGALELAV